MVTYNVAKDYTIDFQMAGVDIRYCIIKDIQYIENKINSEEDWAFFVFKDTSKKLYFKTVCTKFEKKMLDFRFRAICSRLGIQKVKIYDYKIINKEDFISKGLLLLEYDKRNKYNNFNNPAIYKKFYFVL